VLTVTKTGAGRRRVRGGVSDGRSKPKEDHKTFSRMGRGADGPPNPQTLGGEREVVQMTKEGE